MYVFDKIGDSRALWSMERVTDEESKLMTIVWHGVDRHPSYTNPDDFFLQVS